MSFDGIASSNNSLLFLNSQGMRKKNALPKTKAKRPASKNAPVTKSVSKTPPAKKAKKPDVGHDLRSGNRSAPSYVWGDETHLVCLTVCVPHNHRLADNWPLAT